MYAALAVTNGKALASGAGDGKWVMYAEKATGDLYFYDPSRVERIDTLRHVWDGVRYKTSVMGASSFLSLLEINCSERTQRILQSTFFTDEHWENAAMKTDTTTMMIMTSIKVKPAALWQIRNPKFLFLPAAICPLPATFCPLISDLRPLISALYELLTLPV